MFRIMLTGIANPIPWPWGKMAVLTPMTSPLRLNSGPPEFPGLIDCVGLDKIVVRPRPDRAARAADYTSGHGVTQAEGVCRSR